MMNDFLKKLLFLLIIIISITEVRANNIEFSESEKTLSISLNDSITSKKEKTAQDYYDEAEELKKESQEHSKSALIFLAIAIIAFTISRFAKNKNKLNEE